MVLKNFHILSLTFLGSVHIRENTLEMEKRGGDVEPLCLEGEELSAVDFLEAVGHSGVELRLRVLLPFKEGHLPPRAIVFVLKATL